MLRPNWNHKQISIKRNFSRAESLAQRNERKQEILKISVKEIWFELEKYSENSSSLVFSNRDKRKTDYRKLNELLRKILMNLCKKAALQSSQRILYLSKRNLSGMRNKRKWKTVIKKKWLWWMKSRKIKRGTLKQTWLKMKSMKSSTLFNGFHKSSNEFQRFQVHSEFNSEYFIFIQLVRV